MAERILDIIIDSQSLEWYRRLNKKIYNFSTTTPTITVNELLHYQIQLSKGKPIFDTEGNLTNPETDFTETLVTGAVAIDNNFNWEDQAQLVDDIKRKSSIETISAFAEQPPRPIGTLKLDEDDVIQYYKAEKSSNGYLFSLANSNWEAAPYSPKNNYAKGDDFIILEQPIIQSTENNNEQKELGLFSGKLDANTPVFRNMVEGNESIPNCLIEFNLFSNGRIILSTRSGIRCSGAVSSNETSTWTPSCSWVELDSRYIKLDKWLESDEYQFSEDGINWTQTQTFNKDFYYRVRRPKGNWSDKIKLPRGKDGESAYTTWLNAGHIGDEAAFFSYLTGPLGPAGPKGTSNSESVDFYPILFDDVHGVVSYLDNKTTTITTVDLFGVQEISLLMSSANPAKSGAVKLSLKSNNLNYETVISDVGEKKWISFELPHPSDSKITITRQTDSAEDTLEDGEKITLIIYGIKVRIS